MTRNQSAKVLGVGGVFFKARDPKKLAAWYKEWLGMPSRPEETECGAHFAPQAMPPGGYTVWGPFAASTAYFEPSAKDHMFNLVVDDLEGALAQAEEGGGERTGEIEEYDFGRFGWFLDPEGNKVELWQPTPTANRPETER